MVAAAIPQRQRGQASPNTPRYVYHPSFMEVDAERVYRSEACRAEDRERTRHHMPDEVTRDCARRMHYAAFRTAQAVTTRERGRWLRRYFSLRDRIVLGNRKLIFRAIQKWKGANYQAEDLIGECDLVLIRVVATFNPWLGIRFSTFAFTCLMRALSRLWAKIRVEQSVQTPLLEHLADRDSLQREDMTVTTEWEPLEVFFRDEHALLTEREKIVLKRRYGLGNHRIKSTLGSLGQDLGLSKERVRQLEKSALDKLRRAFRAARPFDRRPCNRLPQHDPQDGTRE